MAGLVRFGELSVTFTGTVHAYDALDRSTWGPAVAGATSIARAGAGFSKKNAKFFAGYAFDAHQVPFAWTPPGRVFVGIDLERTALLGEDGVQEGRGRWGGEALSHKTFRSTKGTDDPLAPLPRDVRGELGAGAMPSLTLAGDRGPVVVPAQWRVDGGSLYAALPAETLALAGVGPDAPVALTVDRASEWRARDMVGRHGPGHRARSTCWRVSARGRRPRARSRPRSTRRPGALVRIAPTPPGLVEGMVQREPRGRVTTVEFSVEVDAPPERVWKVTSNPRNLPHWDKHIESVRGSRRGAWRSASATRC